MENLIRAVVILTMLGLFILAHVLMIVCGDMPVCLGTVT